MATIAVTGGSGASGRYIVRELIAGGHEVRNLDRRPSPDDVEFRLVDLEDAGQTTSALVGCDAVVHFAANPVPDFDTYTGFDRFRNNTMATFNVFNAAVLLGIQRVVWASSETTMGFPFENNRPVRVPVTEEDAPQPQNCYAISKVVSEEMARHFARLHGMTILGLRLSNILYEDERDHHDLYSLVPGYWSDANSRKFNLWSYIDVRDAAKCVAHALEADVKGAHNYIVAARDTLMNRPSRELIEEVFPGLETSPDLGPYQSLIDSSKAERELGFVPAYSWRDMVQVAEHEDH